VTDGGGRLVPADDPAVVAATAAVQAGDLATVDQLLAEHPWLVSVQFGDASAHRSLLHAATDWPGHFPNGPDVVRRLVTAGADPNVHCRFDAHTETPLHWAASSDDVAVLDALLDAGADIAAPGAVLGGGTALTDACGFGNWAAARRLVERGSPVTLTDAAALGLLDRLQELLAAGPPAEHVTHALWSACAGGQLGAVEALVAAGADVDWVGWDDLTPLQAAERADADDVAAWLRGRAG
jgi:ankyrin repeat protein